MENLTIKSWADDDKPREKLMLKGKQSLSDAELIAILIGSGSRNETAVDLSKRILSSVGNNLNELGKLTIEQLSNFKGIGEAKAISIIAATELAKRRQSEKALEIKTIESSKQVFEIMQPLIADLDYEEFWVLYLNNSKKLLHKLQLSKGGMSNITVDFRMIFKQALEQNATAIVLVHNHPSGSLKPSDEDVKLTQDLIVAGNQLKIPVYDHLIISQKGYYSFKDNEEILNDEIQTH
jgi:DNA repair protein RadC